MTQRLQIHPQDPQPRLLRTAVELLSGGGVLATPTDTSWALICGLDDKSGLDKLRRIRQLDDKHLMSLACRDLSELANYARVDNAQYRLLKLGTPGPFTFILQASRDVPRRVVNHPKRKTIGLRVPDHKTLQGLLEHHGAPVLITTLILPDEQEPLADADEVLDQLAGQIDAVIDSGSCPRDFSTVIDLTSTVPQVVRHGLGDATRLGFTPVAASRPS